MLSSHPPLAREPTAPEVAGPLLYLRRAPQSVTRPGEGQLPTGGLRRGSPPSLISTLTCLFSPNCKLTQQPMARETAKRGQVGVGLKPKAYTHPQEGLEGRTRVEEDA